MSVSLLTDASIECQRKTDPEARLKVMTFMSNQLNRYLMELKRLKKSTSFLALAYLFVKLVYIANAIGQIFLLNSFLDSPFHLYGYRMIRSFLLGRGWATSMRFPHVTLCDFQIRVLGHVNQYTVQCALPINLFNEKIYTFVWFWLVLVAFFSLISWISWLLPLIYIPRLSEYVSTKLVSMDRLQHATNTDVEAFTTQYLGRDGFLLLWLIAGNSSDLISAELLCEVFDHYNKITHRPRALCLEDNCAARSLRRRNRTISVDVE